MTVKTCLRCDWEGETKEPTCPNCGVPLYEIGASPPVGTGVPVGGKPEERIREVASTASVARSGIRSRPSSSSPYPPDAVESSSRSARSTVAFVVAGLALTVALLSIWLRAREPPAGDGTRSLPARQPGVADPKVEDLTDRNIRDMTPDAPAPKVPYLIDLNTRDMTPLPEAITGSLATGRINFSRFAASPDRSSLAFVGEGDDGSHQIFIAGIDGTGVRQVTHDPKGASSPAWSPDGTMIAYNAYGNDDAYNLFVLDVATGESRQITETRGSGPQFTPDGSSIIYTVGGRSPRVRSVPVAGGESRILIGPGEGLTDAGNASISPDGSLVTLMASGNPNGDEVEHCGPCRILANADGTDKRIITGWYADPAGTWSPDGTRIVLGNDVHTIRVIDVISGEASRVAEGRAAIWLDEHTLLVDV